MAELTTLEKQILEKLFQMGSGYVLNFSDRTMGEFFRDDVGVDIYNQKYNYESGSKANRMRGLWLKADEKLVGKSILKLIEYIENQILLDNLKKEDFDHVQKLLNSVHYFNAVEEAYKIVRQKLKSITGKEKAHEAFAESNL